MGDVDDTILPTRHHRSKNSSHHYHRHWRPSNLTFDYLEKKHGVKGHLSKQFPTIANPAPLGLCAFALTTFVLSMLNAGVIVDLHAQSKGVVLGLALFYGGLIQLLAGMWEMKTGNTFGATVFSSYGGFWMGYAALFMQCFGFLSGYTGGPEEDLTNGVGIFLLAWCIFSLLMTISAHRTTIALVSLLITVTITFLLLSIGEFIENIYLQRAGGITGIVAATMAWYCAMAALLTKKNSLFTLPLGEMDKLYKRLGLLKPHHHLSHSDDEDDDAEAE